MNKRLLSWVSCGMLAVSLAGCDIGIENDITDAQEKSRWNRPIPAATEMPPGLGEDLPLPPATQPVTKDQ